MRLKFVYKKEDDFGWLTVGNIKVKAITDNLPAGTYSIRIPYERHSAGSSYGKYADTWFRIDKQGVSGNRYIHAGRGTAGCVTVIETEKWEKIYQKLIKGRNSSKDIGVLEVISN